MGAQLPSEAVGQAAGILVYSFVCLACSLFLVWLVWIHNERKSYVAMLGFFMSLSALASIVQQIHTIVSWRDVKTDQHENMLANVGNPELHVTGASTGFDRILFYIQYYTYNVDALLVLCWSVELAYSIYQLRSSRLSRFHGSIVAKSAAVVLPALQIVLLRLCGGVQKSTAGFIILADFIMITSFAVGSLLLLAILGKYVHTKLALLSWTVRYGRPSQSTDDGSAMASNGGQARPARRTNIYDRWLVIRFTLAFVALSLFELVVIVFQLRAASNNNRANIPKEPDLSAAKAQSDFALFVPGPSANLLTFVVFGTTRTFRDYMWTLFTPKQVQEKRLARRRARESASRNNAIPASLTRQDVEAGGGGIKLQKLDQGEETQLRGKHDDDEWPIILKSPSPALSSVSNYR